MIEYGLEWHTLDSYFQFKEITAPATPQTNQIRQYASDASGASTMCWKNDAGTVICLPTTAGTLITGSGAADQVTIWSGASTITGGASAKITNLAGTTALVLKGTPNSFVKIDGDATGNPYLEWAQNGTAQARFQYLDSDDSLALSGGPAAVERWRFKADGDLLIGHTTHPVTALAGRGGAILRSAATAEWGVYSFGGSGLSAGYRAAAIRGTISSPTATQLDDGGFYAATAYDGSTYYSPAYVAGHAGENQTPTAHGSYIAFATTALLSTTRAERFRIGPSGQWGIGGATFGSSGDIFSSGGASAAPTWVTRATLNAALDHNVLTNLAVGDVHTQYALLAGRSGGQTLIGGTAASEDLTLKATAHATIGTVIIAEQPLGLLERTLRLGSAGWLGGVIPASLSVSGTIGNTATSHCAFLVDTTFNGAADNPIGLALAPYFAPSSNVGTVRGGQALPQIDPASGVTIAAAQGHDYRLDYVGNDGAVTLGASLNISSPTASGTLKPATQRGLSVDNQGLSGITDAIGIRIEAQSGATNNYVFELPADATDPTGGGGAATGRVRCLIGGTLRYIAYY